MGDPPASAFATSARSVLARTGAVRVTALVLCWTTVALHLAATLTIVDRRRVFGDYVQFLVDRADAGLGAVDSIVELDRADRLVMTTTMCTLGAALATSAALALWSLRIARNLRDVGAADVRVGWASGGWFVPIANLWVPFAELRRGLHSIRGDTTALSWWQGAWITVVLSGLGLQRALDTDSIGAVEVVTAGLDSQIRYAAVQAVALVAAAGFATIATGRAERAVLDRLDRYHTPPLSGAEIQRPPEPREGDAPAVTSEGAPTRAATEDPPTDRGTDAPR